MKTESNNGNRRIDGATEDRGGNVAESSGAITGKDEGRRQKAEVSYQFPSVGVSPRLGKEVLAEAGQIVRLTAKVDQLEAENEQLKKQEKALRRLLKWHGASKRKLMGRPHYYRDNAHNNPLREVDRISQLQSLITGGIPTACRQLESFGKLVETIYAAKPVGTVKVVRA
jgi:hypothetical protein